MEKRIVSIVRLNPLLRGVAATALVFAPLQGMQQVTEQPATENRGASDPSGNANSARLSKTVDPVTDKTFKDTVINSSAPVVVVYVGEANCSSCSKSLKTFEDLAKKNKDRVSYLTLNHETERAADEYIATGNTLPVLIVFKGGKRMSILPGSTTVDEAREYIMWLLANGGKSK